MNCLNADLEHPQDKEMPQSYITSQMFKSQLVKLLSSCGLMPHVLMNHSWTNYISPSSGMSGTIAAEANVVEPFE